MCNDYILQVSILYLPAAGKTLFLSGIGLGLLHSRRYSSYRSQYTAQMPHPASAIAVYH